MKKPLDKLKDKVEKLPPSKAKELILKDIEKKTNKTFVK